eukprot:TRINITY_DN4691_c0_g2_i1.p1 TRINITY_DN4691_c0_g2~~TRINITY_DN4691_c0_g2_i1.p1  ORF type:complete len:971 (-),score=228.66 TRINITY_DN4691_c0_g2_i1:56-2968(-)
MGSRRVENDAIRKSLVDDRKYLIVTLENGLEALLISDPTTDKAAAALDVKIGHAQDPDIAGLAHFLEHMLFLGTEKYPNENSYSEYLADHGGSSNAYTAYDHTNYHFEVLSNYLEEALDRFAQFFVAPLFNESAVGREMNAVDSEHKKNLQNDPHRLYQLMKSTANPNHPFSKFGTGNLQTLHDAPEAAGRNTRAELIEFHKKYYSSSAMKLVVLGKEDLGTLEGWVLDRFSAVKQVPSAVLEPTTKPYEAEQLRLRYDIAPIKDIHKLCLQFPLPSFDKYYVKAPLKPISHLLGHESDGSILSLLKQKGWADALVSGLSTTADDFCLFKVEVGLTESGINFVDDIVRIVFQYITLLKTSGIQKWIYDEIHAVDSMHFIFMHKKSPYGYVRELAADLHNYAPQHVIVGGFLCEEFDPELINEALKHFNPDNLNLYFESRTVADTVDKKDHWYGTEYRAQQIPEQFLQELRTSPLNSSLHLPSVNPFIPTDFVVKPNIRTGEKYEVPVLVKATQMSKVWHKQDNKFNLPKTFAIVNLITPLVNSNPRNYVKAYLLGDLILDSLNEYSYYADIAGLGFRTEVTTRGILIFMKGFSEKLPILFQKVLTKIKGFVVEPERFIVYKQQMLRTYGNFRFDSPVKHTQYSSQYLLRYKRWSFEEKEAVLPLITCEELQEFIPILLSRLSYEMFFYGNITQEESLALAEQAESILDAHALFETELPEERMIQMPAGAHYLYPSELFNTNDLNSGIYSYFQIGIEDTREDVLMDLFNLINETVFYDELRTKQQLGYIVWSGPKSHSGVQGFRVEIQSPGYHPLILDERIETCMRGIHSALKEISPADFQKRVQVLIERKLQKDKKLEEEFHRFWEEISLHHYQFYRAQAEIEELKKVTLEDLLRWFERFLLNKETRTRLTIQHVAKNKWEEYGKALSETDLSGVSVITDISNWKRKLPLFPTYTTTDIHFFEKFKVAGP